MEIDGFRCFRRVLCHPFSTVYFTRTHGFCFWILRIVFTHLHFAADKHVALIEQHVSSIPLHALARFCFCIKDHSSSAVSVCWALSFPLLSQGVALVLFAFSCFVFSFPESSRPCSAQQSKRSGFPFHFPTKLCRSCGAWCSSASLLMERR